MAAHYVRTKVFIEGIEVNFETVTITETRRGMPTATVSVPYLPGLSDIGRYYHPKVHVFYLDLDYIGDPEQASKSDYKLKFSGVIAGAGTSRTKSGSGRATISFNCIHKNIQMDGITMRFSGGGVEELYGDDVASKSLLMNSRMSMVTALMGISKDIEPISAATREWENIKSLPEELFKSENKDKYFDRLSGTTGMFVNLWNQMKYDAHKLSSANPNLTHAMLDMYIPLVEQGLKFFQRMSGHTLIEKEVESERAELPKDLTDKAKGFDFGSVVSPPSLRDAFKNALSSHLSMIVGSMSASFSNEQTAFTRFIESWANEMEYEFITLASPVRKDGLSTETFIKPTTDFYYAPKCNLVGAHLIDSIQVSEDYYGVPTRVTCNHVFPAGENAAPLKFRAPQSIREAIAGDGNIADSIIMAKDQVGEFEWGKGIRSATLPLPGWLAYLYKGNNLIPPEEQDTEGQTYQDVLNAYKYQYSGGTGEYPNRWIPWAKESGLKNYQKVLMAAADSMYARTVASAKSGSANGPFNPYVIAGYPINFIGSNEQEPSYHAMCETVSHTLTEHSAMTSYMISSCMTFEELYSYFLPPYGPWLQASLGFTKKMSLFDNPEAVEVANKFYHETLGVGCVPVDAVYDVATGKPRGINKNSDSEPVSISPNNFEPDRHPETLDDLNPNNTTYGNLFFAKREIESMADYEEEFRTGTDIPTDINFVFLGERDLYSPDTLISETIGGSTEEGKPLEPGQSPYLCYQKRSPGSGPSTSIPNDAPVPYDPKRADDEDVVYKSKNPKDLHPKTYARYERFKTLCSLEGIDVSRVDTYRSIGAQRQTVLSGVRAAPPGKSSHNYAFEDGTPASLGFDVYPKFAGVTLLNYSDNPAVWERVGEIGKSVGLNWGGDFTGVKDYPHFDEPGYRSLLKARFPQYW